MPQPLIFPTGGRLCIRNLSQGQALVGVLHLPADAQVREGDVYALGLGDEELVVQGLDNPLPLTARQRYSGVNDLAHATVWPASPDPTVWSVRFLQAFPEENIWTVYGAHRMDEKDVPDHRWFDVQPDGRKTAIDPPADGRGEALGQLLTQFAVWPGPQGELYTVPQLHSEIRGHMNRYHRLLIEEARNPAGQHELEKKVVNDPELRDLSLGRIDRDFCRYLAHLENLGGLTSDAPRSAQDTKKHLALRDQAFLLSLDKSAPLAVPVKPRGPGMG